MRRPDTDVFRILPSWICSWCRILNLHGRKACLSCGHPKRKEVLP